MTAKVVLNPYSNRWNSQKRWPETEAALKAAGVDFEMVVSERKGHITELVAQAVREKFSPIIISGGDGSIGDALNGLMQAASTGKEAIGPLGIMPTGSANDLVFNVGLPTDLNEAAKVIAAGKTRAMDIGRLNEKYFINNSAGGLEPYVTIKHEKIHWIKGIARYLVAAVQAIMDKAEWQADIQWDDGKYHGPISLVSIGNGRRTGGFFMTPHADPFDGKLTLAFGYRATRLGQRVYRDVLVERTDPRGAPYYWIGGDPPTGLQEAGTDLEALSHGYVSVTPLHMDMTHRPLLDAISLDVSGL